MCEQQGIEPNEQFNYTLDNSFFLPKRAALVIVCYSELFYLMFTSVLNLHRMEDQLLSMLHGRVTLI